MLISRVKIIRGGTDRLVKENPGLINRITADLIQWEALTSDKEMDLIRGGLAVLLIREDRVVLIKGRTLHHLING